MELWQSLVADSIPLPESGIGTIVVLMKGGVYILVIKVSFRLRVTPKREHRAAVEPGPRWH